MKLTPVSQSAGSSSSARSDPLMLHVLVSTARLLPPMWGSAKHL